MDPRVSGPDLPAGARSAAADLAFRPHGGALDRGVALAALATVDAAAGLLAAALAGLSPADEPYPAVFFLACVAMAALSHALAPGWVSAPGPPAWDALKARADAAWPAMGWAATAALIVVIAYMLSGFATAVAYIIPFVFAGAAALGAPWAQAADPRTSQAVPPPAWAGVLAVGGALGVWAVVGALWELEAIRLPFRTGAGFWWPALLLAPFVVTAAAIPHNALAARYAAAAGGRLPSAPVMLRRAAACCAALALLAAALILAVIVLRARR